VEVEQSGTVRVKTVIQKEAQSFNAGKVSSLSQMTDSDFGGVQARGVLLGIGVLVESLPGSTRALMLDIPLSESSDHS